MFIPLKFHVDIVKQNIQMLSLSVISKLFVLRDHMLSLGVLNKLRMIVASGSMLLLYCSALSSSCKWSHLPRGLLAPSVISKDVCVASVCLLHLCVLYSSFDLMASTISPLSTYFWQFFEHIVGEQSKAKKNSWGNAKKIGKTQFYLFGKGLDQIV